MTTQLELDLPPPRLYAYKRRVHPDLVPELELLLDDVEQGKIISVAVVYETADNNIGSMLIGTEDRFRLVGMLFRLIHRATNDMTKDARYE